MDMFSDVNMLNRWKEKCIPWPIRMCQIKEWEEEQFRIRDALYHSTMSFYRKRNPGFTYWQVHAFLAKKLGLSEWQVLDGIFSHKYLPLSFA